VTSVPVSGFELTGERSALRSLARDLWRSRELVRMLSRQEFFVRYRRASFGMLWAVGLPFVQALVLTVVFSRVIPVGKVPHFAAFMYSGLLPWSFFSGTVSGAATSIVDGQGLATKIYFPRAVLPLVTLGSTFYGFVPSIVVLLGLALVQGVHLGPALLLLIPGTALMMLLSASFCLVLSALNVYFRDIRYIVQAATMVWFYATPVIYPLTRPTPTLRHLIVVNPAAGMVELFRAAFGLADPHWVVALAWTAGWVVVLFALAVSLHRRFDRVFVDLL
jgi:lipopolysaccharide transport system permease protein